MRDRTMSNGSRGLRDPSLWTAAGHSRAGRNPPGKFALESGIPADAGKSARHLYARMSSF